MGSWSRWSQLLPKTRIWRALLRNHQFLFKSGLCIGNLIKDGSKFSFFFFFLSYFLWFDCCFSTWRNYVCKLVEFFFFTKKGVHFERKTTRHQLNQQRGKRFHYIKMIENNMHLLFPLATQWKRPIRTLIGYSYRISDPFSSNLQWLIVYEFCKRFHFNFCFIANIKDHNYSYKINVCKGYGLNPPKLYGVLVLWSFIFFSFSSH